MTDINVKSDWTVTGIEYNGLGDKPYFILSHADGRVKLVPVERGVTNLIIALNLEKE